MDELDTARLLIAYAAGMNAYDQGKPSIPWGCSIVQDLVKNNPDKRIGASNAYFSAFTHGYCSARELATSAGGSQ